MIKNYLIIIEGMNKEYRHNIARREIEMRLLEISYLEKNSERDLLDLSLKSLKSSESFVRGK